MQGEKEKEKQEGEEVEVGLQERSREREKMEEKWVEEEKEEVRKEVEEEKVVQQSGVVAEFLPRSFQFPTVVVEARAVVVDGHVVAFVQLQTPIAVAAVAVAAQGTASALLHALLRDAGVPLPAPQTVAAAHLLIAPVAAKPPTWPVPRPCAALRDLPAAAIARSRGRSLPSSEPSPWDRKQAQAPCPGNGRSNLPRRRHRQLQQGQQGQQEKGMKRKRRAWWEEERLKGEW